MKNLAYTSLIFYAFYSCGNKEGNSVEKNLKHDLENQLVITSEGDSLEDGFWQYHTDIDKTGFYRNGYKVGEWLYKSGEDSALVQWGVFENGNVKFNYPKDWRVIDSLEYPMLFQADIPDGNNFTYVVLLEYDLKKLNTTIYDYLYEVNQSREAGSNEILRSKEAKKFYFKNIDIFRYQVVVERDSTRYEAVSYIFEVNGKLFDLTLKDIANEMTILDQEMIRDMLYSMECYGEDLFSYTRNQYYKEENVEFE